MVQLVLLPVMVRDLALNELIGHAQRFKPISISMSDAPGVWNVSRLRSIAGGFA